MHAGWRYYLKQRFKKTSPFYSVGLEFKSETVQLCLLDRSKGEIVWVKQHLLPAQNWAEHLRKYVSDQGLDNTSTHVVLGPSHYQMIQVERPAVKASEINQALLWNVKDLVSFDEPLRVDYFELPAQSAGANKVNVAVMTESFANELISGIEHAGLQITSIGIGELALCNVIGESEEAVLTLMQEAGQEVCLNIVKQGQVYFSRRLRGYENLSTFSASELQMGVGDNLSVEIQRSMDYFESQLRQAPVKKILLALDSPILDELATLLQNLTFMPVEVLVPNIDKLAELEFSNGYLCALGGALSEAQEADHEK